MDPVSARLARGRLAGVDSGLARQVVEIAGRAPSVHNTQPWRWVLTGGDELDLHADRGRQLTRTDPTGRELVLSCGIALGFARLALRGLGLASRVELLPAPDDIDHLARLRVGGAGPAAPDDLELVRAVGRRRTVRDRFDARPVPAAVRDRLRRDVEGEGAWLRWVDSTPDRTEIAVLADRADRMERADPALRAELASWQRNDADDGVPSSALPAQPATLRASDLPLREFRPVDGIGPAGADAQHLPLPAEHPDIAILGTDYDGPVSWLQAGQATARLLLRAAAVDLGVSPLTRALEVPWTRQQLRARLALVGHPQMLFRLGYADLSGPAAPRRPVDDVLEIVADASGTVPHAGRRA